MALSDTISFCYMRDSEVELSGLIGYFTPSPTGNQSEMEYEETAYTAKIRRENAEIHAYAGKAREVILGRSEVIVTSGG